MWAKLAHSRVRGRASVLCVDARLPITDMMPPVRPDRTLADNGPSETSGHRRDLYRARHLLATHSLVHDLMAQKAPLADVLTELVRGIERQSDGLLGSILLFDAPTRTLQHVAAPSLPPRYCAAIDGSQVGPDVGSSGSPAHSARELRMIDVDRDPRWRRFRALAREHGLGACWAVPIVDATGAVLGAFALYYSAPRAPTDDELRLIWRASSLAAVAIERHRASDQLQRLATHDALTGLPNRALLDDQLGQALVRCGRTERLVAVVFLDLDRFKLVNDSMGHDVGDWLLQQVAARLASVVRPGDTVARFGGDEFVVVAESVTRDDARGIGARLHDALRRPFHHPYTGEHTMTASLGIALAGIGDSPQEVLRRADSALYDAKRHGADTRLYHAELRRRATDQLRLDAALRRALEREELRLDYQPIVLLRDGRVVGFEALMRWDHPQLGSVSPARFIPVAEETGLILPIGDWALATAAAAAARWNAGVEPSLRSLRIGVNVSGRQLADPQLPDRVERIVAQTGTDPRQLLIEVTETALIEHDVRAAESLHALAALGCHIALDDFGTGYSSFSRLRSMPIGTIKIDREFIAGLGVEDDATAIVTATIGLAHGLGVTTTAEGVETDAQRAQLAELGCTTAQGYLWAHPMRAADVPGWLAVHRERVEPILGIQADTTLPVSTSGER